MSARQTWTHPRVPLPRFHAPLGLWTLPLGLRRHSLELQRLSPDRLSVSLDLLSVSPDRPPLPSGGQPLPRDPERPLATLRGCRRTFPGMRAALDKTRRTLRGGVSTVDGCVPALRITRIRAVIFGGAIFFYC